ncbi:hypothetical protein KS4_00130 [Poriferisphaera corsica]|uniref:Glutamine amidotransferase domain-containing protein n=1 Tax=Poriferisphaera corsica TaxID=2528020 RepID=A0A517YP34_9BACT|nr:VWA domain-containing protein [Poriferisphaera corsica]QDU31985.1 hypothetical protein KS4_00130 [Poriferisphaera corsica]
MVEFMYSGWLDWMLGLRDVSVLREGSRVMVGWEMPGWMWGVVLCVGFLVSGLSYQRLHGKRWVRIGLSLMRGSVIGLLVWLLLEPMVVEREERVEEDVVVVMLDRSGSMGTRDMEGGESRFEAGMMGAEILLDGIDDEREVSGVMFDVAVHGYERGEEKVSGEGTDLGGSLVEAVKRQGDRPIGGVVVLSDGREVGGMGRGNLRWLKERGVAIYPVVLGRGDEMFDVMIERVDAPKRVFEGDHIPMSVRLKVRGDQENALGVGDIVIKVVDEKDGRVVAEKAMGGVMNGVVELVVKEGAGGGGLYRVVAEVQGDQVEREIGNNERTVRVEVVDEPMRVLYVEGYPRWEHRYLKNMLVREKSIRSSMYLFSADRDFAQEGDDPIKRLPRVREEMGVYDLVVLGDVSPGQYETGFLEGLKDLVADEGMGLVMIGGERFMPRVYAGTVLNDLMPMKSASGVQRMVRGSGRYQFEVTGEGVEMGIFKVGEGEQDVLGGGGRLQMPAFSYAQDLGDLKVSAEVLGRFVDAESNGRQGELAGESGVVWMRYGAGRVLYVGTDEFWRWRYGKGERYFEQAWLGMLRFVGRGRVGKIGEGDARVVVSQDQVEIGDGVLIELEIRGGGVGSHEVLEVVQINDDGKRDAGKVRMQRVMDGGRGLGGWARYVGEFMGEGVGRFELRYGESTGRVEVLSGEDEMLDVRADIAGMRQLAEQTGGELIAFEDVGDLRGLIPSRARVVPMDRKEGLGRSPGVFGLLLLLLGIEWVGRKLVRLA